MCTGGQIFDTGLITSADGTNALKVDNVQVFGGYVLHSGAVEAGQLQVGTHTLAAKKSELMEKKLSNAPLPDYTWKKTKSSPLAHGVWC